MWGDMFKLELGQQEFLRVLLAIDFQTNFSVQLGLLLAMRVVSLLCEFRKSSGHTCTLGALDVVCAGFAAVEQLHRHEHVGELLSLDSQAALNALESHCDRRYLGDNRTHATCRPYMLGIRRTKAHKHAIC